MAAAVAALDTPAPVLEVVVGGAAPVAAAGAVEGMAGTFCT